MFVYTLRLKNKTTVELREIWGLEYIKSAVLDFSCIDILSVHDKLSFLC